MINDMNIEEVNAVNGGCIILIPPAVVIAVAKYILKEMDQPSETSEN